MFRQVGQRDTPFLNLIVSRNDCRSSDTESFPVEDLFFWDIALAGRVRIREHALSGSGKAHPQIHLGGGVTNLPLAAFGKNLVAFAQGYRFECSREPQHVPDATKQSEIGRD